MTIKATRLAACAVLSIALLAGAGPSGAHHSFAMFDNDHQIKLAGTVADFTWQNPARLHQPADRRRQGAVKHWTIECANPGILDRQGWKFNMIKVGDKLTAIVAPLRTGEPARCSRKLPSGRAQVQQRRPAGPALIH